MQVLMPETSSTAARMAAKELREAGHVVHTCHEPAATGPSCVAMHDAPCPLEARPIDVAVDVRPVPLPMPRLDEEGVRCAIRRHIPLVVAGRVTANPFRPWTTAQCAAADVVETAEATATAPHGDLQADDICMDDGPRILDCLEFDDRLRAGDMVADVTFSAIGPGTARRPSCRTPASWISTASSRA